jgi:hypothetical protein
LVLVGALVAPLLGLVESTVTLCARKALENANPTRTTASGSAASHHCGFDDFTNLFISCPLPLNCNDSCPWLEEGSFYPAKDSTL